MNCKCAWQIFQGYDGEKEIWTLCNQPATGIQQMTEMAVCKYHLKKSNGEVA